MKRFHFRLVPALLGSALLAASLPGDSVAFRPEQGLSLTRAFSSKQEITLDEMNMTMNGNPMAMEMEMTMSMSQGITVTDEFLETAGGQVERLRRSFDKLESDGSFTVEAQMMPEPTEKTITAKSELEGKTVLFQRDPETKEFKPSFKDDEGDPKLLEKLEQDMDFLALLPSGETKEGESWPVEASRLGTILAYGGDLALKPDVDAEELGGMSGMDNMGDFSKMVEDMEGEATCEYLGTREVDGLACSVIRLKFKVKSAKDLTEEVRDQMGANLPEGAEMEVDHVDIEIEMEGEGELLWNAAAGYARSFSLSSTVKSNMDMGFSVSMQGQNMQLDQSMSMSGTYDSKAEITKN